MSRRLSAEDRAIWERVKASVTPLHPAQAIPAPVPTAPAPTAAPPPRAPEAAPPPAPWRPDPFRLGERAAPAPRADVLLPPLGQALAAAPLRMDAGRARKMRAGRLAPEARIDLHGMTLAEAHPALATFILQAHARGLRLVLVITGKGRLTDDLAPMPVRQGRLRHDVPRWLALPPLASAVLQVAPAHRRHGGAGALYVYLRA